MKKIVASKYAPLSIIAIQIFTTLILYSSLPDRFPMHYSALGTVDWYLPKMFGVWMIPCLSIIIAIIGFSKRDTTRSKLWFSSIVMGFINITFLLFVYFQ